MKRQALFADIYFSWQKVITLKDSDFDEIVFPCSQAMGLVARKVFQAVDKNQDSEISWTELQVSHSSVGFKVQTKEAK